MFQVCGAFAEFERSMIKTRIHAGLKRARTQGKTLGRPKLDDEKAAAILRSLKKGVGIKKPAATLGCGIGTVIRVRNEATV
jgi:DNA invertase Pin-like site-specific DNA recombinase